MIDLHENIENVIPSLLHTALTKLIATNDTQYFNTLLKPVLI